jgi:hypothetical protein
MEWVLITPFGGASQFTPVFLGGTCCSIFRILCSVLQIIACPFSFGHCFTASDYPFGIYQCPLSFGHCFTASDYSFGI